MAIAKASGSVDFIGIVGPNGKWLIDELRGHGVGVGGMITAEVRNSHSSPSIVTLKMEVGFYHRESNDSSC